MRPGWNPLRRNRKIGVARPSKGRDNRMVVPLGRLFERGYDTVHADIEGQQITVITERLPDGFMHGVNADEVLSMLNLIPAADRGGLRMFILKYPTRKELVLDACWGRMQYAVTIDGYEGPAVLLYASDLKPFRLNTSLNPRHLRELQRLRDDGHDVREEKRRIIVAPSAASLHTHILYRTLLHEVGHWQHYLQKVERPAAGNEAQCERLWHAFTTIPEHDCEDYADRYAQELRARLTERKLIPLPTA